MKLFCLLFIAFYSGYAKEDSLKFELEYTLLYKSDSTNLDKIRSERFILEVGNTQSCFHSWISYKEDSISNVKRQLLSEKVVRVDQSLIDNIYSRFRYKVFFNYTDEKTTVEERIYSNIYEFNSILNPKEWVLTNEMENISGYNCQKALIKYGGRNFIAWFTNEVPIVDGPYIFKGLPGLIVKVFDKDNHYNFELTNIRKISEGVITRKNTNSEFTTFEKISKMKYLYRTDPGSLGGNVGTYLSSMPNYDSLRKRRVMSNNNPLECNQ